MSVINKQQGNKPVGQIVKNRRASYDYLIDSQFEAGLVLEGWEVKSLRAKKADPTGAFVIERGGELFLTGVRIDPLISTTTHVVIRPDRNRKLLLSRREINQIIAGINRKSYTCICLSLHWKSGKAKAAIALARGKRLYDKRAQSKEEDWQREQQRILKHQLKTP